jgi:hypothetical protein
LHFAHNVCQEMLSKTEKLFLCRLQGAGFNAQQLAIVSVSFCLILFLAPILNYLQGNKGFLICTCPTPFLWRLLWKMVHTKQFYVINVCTWIFEVFWLTVITVLF